MVKSSTKETVECVKTSPQGVIFLLQWLTWEKRSCGIINIVDAKLLRFLNPTLRIKHTLLWPRCHFPTRWFVYPSDFRSSGRVPYSGSKPRDEVQDEDIKKTNRQKIWSKIEMISLPAGLPGIKARLSPTLAAYLWFTNCHNHQQHCNHNQRSFW